MDSPATDLMRSVEESFDVSECASLISNSFTLNSGGPRPVAVSRRNTNNNSNNGGRGSQERQRHPLSLFSAMVSENATVMGLDNDDESRSPLPKPSKRMLLADDVSFYDGESSTGHGQQYSSNSRQSMSPRLTCSALTSPYHSDSELLAGAGHSRIAGDNIDDDDDTEVLHSADSSPVTFKVIDNSRVRNNKAVTLNGSRSGNSNENVLAPAMMTTTAATTDGGSGGGGTTATTMAGHFRRSFEDSAAMDSSSMDSGYDMPVGSCFNQFRFAQPTRAAPRRLDSGIASPTTTRSTASTATEANGAASMAKSRSSSFSVFNHCSSQGSVGSLDEEYLELFEMEEDEEEAEEAKQRPSNISSLICGAIKSSTRTPERKSPSTSLRVRRCLNLDESPAAATTPVSAANHSQNDISMNSERSLVGILTPRRMNSQESGTPTTTTGGSGKGFKRPEPLLISPVQSKRHKSEVFANNRAVTAHPRLERFHFDEAEKLEGVNKENVLVGGKSVPLQRAVSMNEEIIKSALSRSSTEPDLIGDFSKPFCLPLMEGGGRHKDLKSITVDTMAMLVAGQFDASVASFKIVDCRYPYEFEGGHIRGARNLYMQEQILSELVNEKATAEAAAALNPENGESRRHILVFHCEFSSERGPKLYRFLRNHDRQSNEYPALHYPEIYLLNGGYKEFYENYPELCDPVAYRTMLDPGYGDEYRNFRAKTKSWNGIVDTGRATTFNRTKSRSRLLL